MKVYTGKIVKLNPDEVFVFGSNYAGFHGAGSAGYATFGSNVRWRQMKYDKFPDGTKFKWNVKGIGEGFQIGNEGRSYALPTVFFLRGKNIPVGDTAIHSSIKKFYQFANDNPHYQFILAYNGSDKRYLNGRTPLEMARLFCMYTIPKNLVVEKEFGEHIKTVVQVENRKYMNLF